MCNFYKVIQFVEIYKESIPARLGFINDPIADPTARAPRSRVVSGTWPG